MQITLNQDEIIEAVVAYVHGQISVAPNQKIEVDLKAGRGENGFTATLDIRSTGTALGSVVAKPVVTSEVEPGATNIKSQPAPAPISSTPLPAAPAEEAKPVKVTKGSGIFGKAAKTVSPDPLPAEEPVGALPEAVTPAAVDETVLPHQDPANEARLPQDELGSELDDALEEAPAPTPAVSGSIFKFSKGA